MSNCHPGKFSKWEESVRLSSWQIFKNGRKMFNCHPGKFQKTRGNCLAVILANFQKWEKNVRLSSWQISRKGGKCPTVILTDFQKREEIVRLSSLQIFKNGRKMSDCHHCKFSKTGVKCLYVRFDNFSLTIIQSWEEIVPFAIMTLF